MSTIACKCFACEYRSELERYLGSISWKFGDEKLLGLYMEVCLLCRIEPENLETMDHQELGEKLFELVFKHLTMNDLIDLIEKYDNTGTCINSVIESVRESIRKNQCVAVQKFFRGYETISKGDLGRNEHSLIPSQVNPVRGDLGTIQVNPARGDLGTIQVNPARGDLGTIQVNPARGDNVLNSVSIPEMQTSYLVTPLGSRSYDVKQPKNILSPNDCAQIMNEMSEIDLSRMLFTVGESISNEIFGKGRVDKTLLVVHMERSQLEQEKSIWTESNMRKLFPQLLICGEFFTFECICSHFPEIVVNERFDMLFLILALINQIVTYNKRTEAFVPSFTPEQKELHFPGKSDLRILMSIAAFLVKSPEYLGLPIIRKRKSETATGFTFYSYLYKYFGLESFAEKNLLVFMRPTKAQIEASTKGSIFEKNTVKAYIPILGKDVFDFSFFGKVIDSKFDVKLLTPGQRIPFSSVEPISLSTQADSLCSRDTTDTDNDIRIFTVHTKDLDNNVFYSTMNSNSTAIRSVKIKVQDTVNRYNLTNSENLLRRSGEIRENLLTQLSFCYEYLE
jgi:hypothetical protein